MESNRGVGVGGAPVKAANFGLPGGLCTVTTVRAPKEEILPFINYHLNVGIDHMFFFFDDPADAAVEALAGNSGVTCTLCTPEYWAELGKRNTGWLEEFDGTKPPLIENRQRLNATVGLEMARARNFEWIAHIDVDELLYAPHGGLRALLNDVQCSVDFVRFPVLEAVANDLNDEIEPMQSIDLFKVAEFPSEGRAQPTIVTRLRRFVDKITNRSKRAAAKLTQARPIFANGRLIVGHSEGKSFVRASSNVNCLECHMPVAKPGSTLRFMFARDGYLLHFDCCNFDEWYSKWLRRCDGTGTLGTMGWHRRKQFTKFRTLYERGANEELRALYREQCLIPDRALSPLLRLSLVKRIKLSDTLFEEPPTSASTGEHLPIAR